MPVQNLHIKKLRVENYKSLKDSEIEFNEGLNIIIGKNGSGKSNLLEFIRGLSGFPKNLLGHIYTNFSVSYEYCQKKQLKSFSYSISRNKRADNKNNNFFYELILKRSSDKNKSLEDIKLTLENETKIVELSNLEKELNIEQPISSKTGSLYVPFKTPERVLWIATPGKIDIERDFMPSMHESTGFHLLTELQKKIELRGFEDLLKNENDGSYSIEKEAIIPFLSYYLSETHINDILERYTIIKKIRFNPNINVYQTEEKIILENLVIDFLIDDDWLPWSYLSDGTKRMFYLISEALSLKEGILLVEEPELGIHPHQLYKIMDFLKEQSRNKQIIVSTHSPIVLDALNQDELGRIIIAKYENGTKFTHLTEEQISKAKRYMNEVGELSYYWLHSDLEK